MRHRLAWIGLSVVACIGLAAGPKGPPPALPLTLAAVQRPPAPEVTCAACIVVDDAGRVLYGRAVDEHRSNASTTKMVTALLVIRRAELDEQVSVSAAAAAVGAGGIDLQPGDVYSVEELLYALLLSSSNDSAVALAEHVAGSEPAFVEKMNRWARAMGLSDSRFVTAHGLDQSGHYSSARDLATIGWQLLAHPRLADIVATSSTVVVGPNGPQTIENRNLLLESYRGAIGIKTGFTSQAGNVLVAAARRSGRTVIAVAMGSVDATADARALLDYGWARLRQSVLLRAGRQVGAVVWPFGGSTGLVAADSVRGMADPSSLQVTFEPRGSGETIAAGEPVGRLVVRAGSREVGVVAALASDTVIVDETPWPASIASTLLRAAARVTGRL